MSAGDARSVEWALTLKQPWAWCVAAGHKTVENRNWKPWASVVGARIAIHAGQAMDAEALASIAERFQLRPVASEMARGAVIAVARVDGFVTESDDPWFSGPFGWLLGEVTAIPPVPCRGAQGLWRMPDRVRRPVVERFLVAKR